MKDLSFIAGLAKEVYEDNKAKGFWDEPVRSFPEAVMLVVTELGEAVNADRAGNHVAAGTLDKVMGRVPFDPAGFREGVKDTVEDELADAMIRILDLCGGFGIDIGRHIAAKLEYNRTRAHKHGKLY